jgi:diguanylate cyclase (GGDEF)-like protein
MVDLRDDYLFYSDFNCPFCFALNERILAIGESPKIAWRGIQHMPAADSNKSTLVDQTQLITEVGVVRKRAPEVAIVTPAFRPNTGLANLLMLRLADAERHQRAHLRTLIYRAYWQDGCDISDANVLAELCAAAGLAFPGIEPGDDARQRLDAWQAEWEGERFHRRLPAMISQAQDKPLLGFPTFDLLTNFFAGSELPVAPESLAACELKPKQGVLLVGADVRQRCNVTELEAAYQFTQVDDVAAAREWFVTQTCLPDMVVLDYPSLGGEALKYCTELRKSMVHRQTALIMLLSAPEGEIELAAFDAGATDVMFDLSNPKVCQARLDLQLRMKRSSTLLASLARLDYLTELPNRREFDRKFEQEWLRARRDATPLSVVLIDIDHFKAYNDHYGHSMGDDCLRQVARAMRNGLRRPADQLARYGGEEFVAVLPRTPAAGAAIVAEQMVQAVRDVALPHAYSLCAKHVTVSIGVACVVPNDTGDSTPRGLVEVADAALYEAKKTGRDRVVVAGR